jgi:hypothetical protein
VRLSRPSGALIRAALAFHGLAPVAILNRPLGATDDPARRAASMPIAA